MSIELCTHRRVPESDQFTMCIMCEVDYKEGEFIGNIQIHSLTNTQTFSFIHYYRSSLLAQRVS